MGDIIDFQKYKSGEECAGLKKKPDNIRDAIFDFGQLYSHYTGYILLILYNHVINVNSLEFSVSMSDVSTALGIRCTQLKNAMYQFQRAGILAVYFNKDTMFIVFDVKQCEKLATKKWEMNQPGYVPVAGYCGYDD